MFRHRTESDKINFEKEVKQNAMKAIQSGKLDLYEYALYIEQEMNLYELKQVVEKQIREEMYDELSQFKMQSYD